MATADGVETEEREAKAGAVSLARPPIRAQRLPSSSPSSLSWDAPQRPPSLLRLFELPLSAAPADGRPLGSSLPLLGSLQPSGVEEWKRKVGELRKRVRESEDAQQVKGSAVSLSSPAEPAGSTPLLPTPDLRSRRLTGWTWEGNAVEGGDRKAERADSADLQVQQGDERRGKKGRGGEEDGVRGVALQQLQAEVSSLSPSVLLQREATWNAFDLLQPGLALSMRSTPSSSFSSSSSAVSFVSRASYAVLELDVAYGLLTSAQARSASSFRANAALPASAMFLAYVDLSGRSERGGLTEAIQWRRRSCQLRARGWGLALPQHPLTPLNTPDAEEEGARGHEQSSAVEAADGAVWWRLPSFNPVAREQAVKNFTACPPSTSLDAFLQLVGRHTEGKGVQLVLGAAASTPQQQQPPSHAEGVRAPPPPPLPLPSPSSILVDLLSALCVCFGVLQSDGCFAYRLCRASELLRCSPLLLSCLHLLRRTFERIQLHRTRSRSWREDELWIVATRMRISRGGGGGGVQPGLLTAAFVHSALREALRSCVDGPEGLVGCEQWSVGSDWQADAAFLEQVNEAVQEVQRQRLLELRLLALHPSASSECAASFRSPSAAARTAACERLLAELDLARRQQPHTPAIHAAPH